MGDPPMVLVLTGADDPTAEVVIAELRRRNARIHRIDLADFPIKRGMVARFDRRQWSATLTTLTTDPLGIADRSAKVEVGDVIDLSDVSAVYYRRPSRFVFPAGMSAADRAYAEAEARIGVGGVLAALRCRWVSHPHTVTRAEWKPLQLQVAADVGLAVPRTLVSNDPRAAREFVVTTPGRVVVKPMSSVVLADHARPDQALITFASLPQADEMVGPDFDQAFSATTHLLQEWVPKAREARVTVCGTRLLATAIEAHSERARIDWRTDYANLTYTPITVPDAVAEGIRAYLDALGLLFGAFDFVLTPDDEWVMLECNPNGQWLWLHYQAGLPIPAAMADLLTSKDDAT